MKAVARAMLCALAALAGATAMAQPRWRAALPPVKQAGFHIIRLSPEVVGRSQADLRDLRLVDSAGKEVPYVLELEPETRVLSWTTSFALLRNDRIGKHTVVEFAADSAKQVDELLLRIRNAEVDKTARILGSDDRAEWYMIKDQCIAVSEGTGGTSALRFIDLPQSDYRFYRIELDDSLSAPVQVMALGHSARSIAAGRLTPIRGLKFVRVEHGNKSRFGLFTGYPFRADRLLYSASGEGLFLRHGSYSEHAWHTSEQHRRAVRSMTEDPLGELSLASNAHGLVRAPGVILDTLWITLENQNDQPLVVDSILAYQFERRLLARLSPEAQYFITTDDPAAQAPGYDLQHFRDSLPPPLDTLQVAAMSAIPGPPPQRPFIDPHRVWLWVVLIGLGAIAAFSAIRLLRQSSRGDGSTPA